MKIYKLAQLAEMTQEKRVELGKVELGAENIGILYQTLSTKKQAIVEKSSNGREEIIYIVKGRLKVTVKKSSFTVSSGEAFYTDKEVLLENRSDTEAAFITASANTAAAAHTTESKACSVAPKGKVISEETEQNRGDEVEEIYKTELTGFIISNTDHTQAKMAETEPLADSTAVDESAVQESGQAAIEEIFSIKAK